MLYFHSLPDASFSEDTTRHRRGPSLSREGTNKMQILQCLSSKMHFRKWDHTTKKKRETSITKKTTREYIWGFKVQSRSSENSWTMNGNLGVLRSENSIFFHLKRRLSNSRKTHNLTREFHFKFKLKNWYRTNMIDFWRYIERRIPLSSNKFLIEWALKYEIKEF